MKRLGLLFSLFAALLLSARTVYVTRHGQVGDKACYDDVVKENKLTPLGQLQAQKLAKYLVEKRGFNGTILCSPMYRTIETGSFTALTLKKKEILDPGLQEMTWGKKRHPRDGMTLKEIEARFPGLTEPGSTFSEPWRLFNESDQQRYVRVSEALARILKEHKGDLLLVGHGASVNDLVKILNQGLDRGKRARGMAWNCILYIFVLDENDKVVSAEYCTEHLPDAELTDNFKCPKIERPDDPKYWTRQYQNEYYAKRRAKAKAAKEKAAKAVENKENK